MTKYASQDVSFYLIGGYSLLGDVTELGYAKEAETKDDTVLGNAWRSHAANGLKMGEFTQNGFFNDTADRIHDALKAGSGVSRVGLLALEGGAIGDKVIGFEGLLQMKYERSTALGEWVGAQGSYQVSGAIEEGEILHALGAETANGETEASSLDNAASSSDGGAGIIQLTEITLDSATNLVGKVIHSADDATFADLVTFTALTERGAERVAVTGTVNRYVASKWAFTGGAGASTTATFVIAFSRN